MKRQSLGELELLVLLAVARLGPERAYAVSIADEIHERTGRPVQRATVYVTLQRLDVTVSAAPSLQRYGREGGSWKHPWLTRVQVGRRMVVVHGATRARPRWGMATSRLSTTTGRRPMAGGSHHQTSPRRG